MGFFCLYQVTQLNEGMWLDGASSAHAEASGQRSSGIKGALDKFLSTEVKIRRAPHTGRVGSLWDPEMENSLLCWSLFAWNLPAEIKEASRQH